MNLRGNKRIKGISLLLVILALCPILLGATPSHTDRFYVNDYANVLSEETENYIFENALSLDRQTTAQICVLTIHNLNGEDISEYAVEVFRQWGIGDADKDNGVLILLSVDDREMWVTTGYGIEGTLTDTRLGQFRDDYAIPYYSENDFDTGTKELFNAILNCVMEEEYGLDGLDGYSYDDYYGYESEYDTGDIVGFNLILLAPVIFLFFSDIYHIYLVIYDKRHGTFRAPTFRANRRRILKNIFFYIIISGRGRGGRSGRSGGGFSGGGGGFSGGGGSTGGGGAGGRF